MGKENGSKSSGKDEITGDPRITVNFPTVLDKISFNELLESIVVEPKLQNRGRSLTKGEAANLVASLAKKQFVSEGYGVGRDSFVNRYYTHFEPQVNNLLGGLEHVLINCDRGIDAIQKQCEKQVQDLKEKMEKDRLRTDKILTDNAEYISQLETQNADVTDENKALIKQNDVLSSLRESYDMNISAWDKERENLTNKIASLKQITAENAKLLKQQKDHKDRSNKLNNEMVNLKHEHQLALKETELQYQKEMASLIKVAVEEKETQIESRYNTIITDLKEQNDTQKKEKNEKIAVLRSRIDDERREFKKQLKEMQKEERGIANAEIERLQELIKGEMANVERAQMIASKTKDE